MNLTADKILLISSINLKESKMKLLAFLLFVFIISYVVMDVFIGPSLTAADLFILNF